MGRLKGSQTKPRLDPNNIIESSNKDNDENANPVTTQKSLPPHGRSKAVVSTRGAKKGKASQVYNDLVGPAIGFFPQSKLPQNKVVLQRYLSLKEHGTMVKQFKLVNILYSELINVWKPARIFTLPDKKCKKIIDSLINKFTDFKKHTYIGSNDCPRNIEEFKALLVKLCDLAPPNLQELIKGTHRLNKVWEEDWQFYLNMCQAKQVGCVAGRDVKLAIKEQDKEKRLVGEVTKKVKSDAQKRKIGEVVTGEDFDDGDQTTPSQDDDPDMVVTMKRKRAKVQLEIDPTKIVEQTAGTFDRLGLSTRQTAMVLASVVKAGGGDLTEVQLSRSLVQRKRKKVRVKQGRKIMDSFVHSESYVLHYDTKLVNPKGRDTEDRAAVLYSGGVHQQPYLLGIPKFASSKVKDVEAGMLKELDKYGIELADCVATCYDTTSSNSGHKEGAHFRIEKRVGHAILELECRKHVQERHVTHANKAVFGPTKGPQKAHYKGFKDA
jgi:hypothetical protein